MRRSRSRSGRNRSRQSPASSRSRAAVRLSARELVGSTACDSKAREISWASTPISAVLADVDGTLVTKDKVLTERAIAGREPAARARHRLHDLQRPSAARHAHAGRAARPDDADGGIQWRRDRAARSVRARRAGAARLPAARHRRGDRGARPRRLDLQRHRLVRPVRQAPRVDRESSTIQFEPTVVPTFDGVLAGVVKIVGVSDDHARSPPVKRTLQQDVRDAGLRRAVAAALPRRDASDGQQGRRHRAAGAIPENPAGGHRDASATSPPTC